jgi:hypothetical protein
MACVYIPTPVLGFIKVVLIWFFFTCACAVVTFFLSRQYIIDNWVEYKCNPMITPFASAFGKDSAETMKECSSANFRSMSFDMHMPFMNIFDSFSTALGDTGSMLGDMSFVSGNMAGSFGANFSQVLGQLGNVGATIQYLMIKIETLLQRLVATIAVIMFAMSSVLQGVVAVSQDQSLLNLIDELI